ncbi:M-phase inducer phosphatase-like [Diabrotica virgifera virgifera]|uniref:protein-tyrosine-phosphatase n=1 Tax=Diabrotica virgifera virgifera TaxID=50390 RepID=A0ABM5ILX4_DIAVI|nr:M-phase inducer phosphatase-like [Diabrotica virgifera virgifera]
MWDSFTIDDCQTCPYNSTTNIYDQMEVPHLDKENIQPFNHIKNDELSLYDNGGSITKYREAPLSHTHRPLEEHDSNSQDSGYSASYHGEKFLSYASPVRTASTSFGSMVSMEDEYFDFSDVEPLEKPNLPHDFNKLITNPLINRTKPEVVSSPKDTIIRPLFRRALSLQPISENTPNSRRVRTSLFRGEHEIRSFKRPEPPNDLDSTIVKRSKIFNDNDDSDCEASVPVARTRPILQRAFSATEDSIMCAVQRSAIEPDLIGDFTKNFSLPLTISRHQDLKAITADTLASLMRGEFSDAVDSYKVIDCRYPYEFDGGHINDALNFYTKEQCMQLLNSTPDVAEGSHARHILVFHCEFSSERGPNLYRFLRKEDRNKNESVYPSLNFPEIYLLEGGYKKFFETHPELCTPVAYKEMLHPDHEDEYRHFRSKSKTWNCDSRQRLLKKRLGV